MQKKIKNIQILRGLACLFVVYCHTAVGNGIGKYGVDIRYAAPYRLTAAGFRIPAPKPYVHVSVYTACH